jgi:hypothetical protein
MRTSRGVKLAGGVGIERLKTVGGVVDAVVVKKGDYRLDARLIPFRFHMNGILALFFFRRNDKIMRIVP